MGDNIPNMKKVKLNADDPAIPCGLVAKSVFTDRYTLSMGSSAVTINENGIAWESDKEYKFKNTYNNLPSGKTWEDVQWINMENGNYFITNN